MSGRIGGLPSVAATSRQRQPDRDRPAVGRSSCHPRRTSASRSHSVDGMEYLSDDECRQIAVRLGAERRTPAEVVQATRDVEAGEFAIADPAVIGPGLPPEDGSCGQFAVAFHVSTVTVAALKRIADRRGVTVPELCRQVLGVFVDQQEGDLSALIAAEADAARPSLRGDFGPSSG